MTIPLLAASVCALQILLNGISGKFGHPHYYNGTRIT
jgi:hypothetical protein